MSEGSTFVPGIVSQLGRPNEGLGQQGGGFDQGTNEVSNPGAVEAKQMNAEQKAAELRLRSQKPGESILK